MSQRPELDLLIRGDLVLPGEVARGAGVGVRDGVIAGLYGPSRTRPRERPSISGGSWFFRASWTPTSTPTASPAGRASCIIRRRGGGRGHDVHRNALRRRSADRQPRALRAEDRKGCPPGQVDIALLATLKKEGTADVIAPLVKMGACGFKLSRFETDPTVSRASRMTYCGRSFR